MRRQMWLQAIKRDDFTEQKLKHALVCSKHFVSGQPSKLEHQLDPDWVPTVNMGFESSVVTKKSSRVHKDTHSPNQKQIRVKIVATSGIPRLQIVKDAEEGRGNRNCCVPGCKSVYKKNKSLMYHYFPKVGGEKIAIITESGQIAMCDQRKVWVIKLGIKRDASNCMSVCSLHFKDEDYDCSGWSSRKRLKKGAVPSQNLPVRPHEKNVSQTYQRPVEINNAVDNAVLIRPGDFENVYIDSGVQVNSEKIINNSVHCDQKLYSLTGIHSFALLTSMVLLLTNYKQQKRLYRLSAYNRVVLVFVKLKLDLPFAVLSMLFGVKERSCKNIFIESVVDLSEILKNSIHFSSVEEIRNNMPECFANFKNVCIMLDCIEIISDQPPKKRTANRANAYSAYKGTNSIKFMTGTNPDGLITYISEGYGGQVTDTKIFMKSGLLPLLRPHLYEAIVDNGYTIGQLRESTGVKIARPHFLKDKNYIFAEDYAVTNAKLASARVHIERTNQRIKNFRILKSSIPVDLVSVIQNIFTVICSVVNLSKQV